jgi:hypothetical protein
MLAGVASIGDYAIFAGGAKMTLSGGETAVYTYNTSLTVQTLGTKIEGRCKIGATSIGNYAVFAGGQTGSIMSYKGHATVDAFDKSLTHSTPTALSAARYSVRATTVGDYALFAGGGVPGSLSTVYSTAVDAYNKSLTRSTPTVLSVGRYDAEAASVGDYAIFAGGYGKNTDNKTTPLNAVDAYSKSLTRTTLTALDQATTSMSGLTAGDYALFAGGYYYPDGTTTTTFTNTVYVYDKSLTRTTKTLSAPKSVMGAAVTGDYALFAGGSDGSQVSSVDVFVFG